MKSSIFPEKIRVPVILVRNSHTFSDKLPKTYYEHMGHREI